METGGAPSTTQHGNDAVRVTVEDHQSDHCVDGSRYARLLGAALADQGVAGPAEVGLAFIDAEEMAELNGDHMGKSGPTDVLAFPIDGAGGVPAGQPALVGDIAIAPVVADRAAQPLADELALLVVHGALHLLGHDHAEPDEAAVMNAIQRDLLDRFWVSGDDGARR